MSASENGKDSTHEENACARVRDSIAHCFCSRWRRQASLLPERRRNGAGVLYTPASKGLFPGLIVIHEYWGLTDWVKEQASKLADQGHVTLAVDLCRGKVATTLDLAHEIMRGVAEDGGKRDRHAAFKFLESRAEVKKDRIGAIGCCMGGGYSLEVALEEPDLAAHVINYGHLATGREALKKINAPILGLFGGQDHGITPDDVRKTEQVPLGRRSK